MSKVLKNIVDGVISNEFNNIQDENLEDMKDLKKYNELGATSNKLYRDLEKCLPEEHHYLLGKLEEVLTQQLCLEIRYYFRKGVKAGLTNLDYLKEAEAEIIML